MPLNPFAKKPREYPPSKEVTANLRTQWLDGTMVSKDSAPRDPSDVIAVLMELGLETGGAITFVSAHDGHASLYTDEGGGIIGAGFHVPTAAASFALVGSAQGYLPMMPLATTFPLPHPGYRSFWLITRGGVHGVSFLEKDVRKDSPINPLFESGQNFITNFRLVDTKLKKGISGGLPDHLHIFPDGGICFLTFGNPTPVFLTLPQLTLLLGIAKQIDDPLDVSTASGDANLQKQVIDTIKYSGARIKECDSPPGLVPPKGGNTLHHAVIISRIDIARDLIARGADIESKDSSGYTPLALAAYFGRTQLLKTLIEMKANVQSQDNQGNSVLMFAAQWGDLEAVKVLLSSGADFAVQAKNGHTALKVARLCSQAKVVELLQSLGAPE
ncbi:MAG: ankyrin repeat domain-containing protein [Nitrososphaerales archaeon]|jgi:ankyrin repeat protein